MNESETKYIVCPECQGEGYVSKLDAFTQEDLDEWYGGGIDEDEFVEDYMRRGGPYDMRCPLCKAQRVVTPQEVADWDEQLALDAEYEAERRMGA